MTDKKNKKIFTRHPAVTKFLVVFLTGSFLFGGNALAVNDYTKATGATPVSTSWNSLVSNYDKPLNGSLSAPEWNGLFYDFVNTWTTANMAGPLGIGSASPSAALDIFSKVKITSGGIIYNTDSGRYLDMSGVLSDSLKVSGNLYSTAGVLKIDGTGNNYLMGNVGIGTVSPAAALHVNYPTSGSAIFQVGTADGGSNADIKLGYNGYGWYWRYLGSGAGDNNELQLWSEGAGGTDQQAYGIKQSGIITFPKNVYFGGKVGISTTTPTSALDVNGLIKMRSYTISQPEDVINKSYLDSALSSSTASIITQVATSSFWQGSLTGNVYNSNTGNIGIGTTTPGAKLDVNGSIKVGGGSSSNWASINVGGSQSINAAGSIYSYNSVCVSNGSGACSGSGGVVIGLSNTSANTNFPTSGNSFINNGGNLGVGTNNPGAKFEVSGDIRALNGNFTGDLSLSKYGSYPNLNITSYSDTSWHGARIAPIRFRGTASTPAAVQSGDRLFWFDPYAYDGSSAVRAGQFVFNVDGAVSTGIVPTAFSVTTADNTGAQRTRINMGSNDDIYMSVNGGNVGIGTSNPLFNLDVNGTAQFNNSVIVGTPTAASHAATKSYVDSAAGGGVGAGTSGQTLRHNGTSWVANSILYNNGVNIGIGTSAPSNKFQIYSTSGRVAVFGDVGASTSTTSPVNVSFGSTYGNDTPGSVNNLKWDLFSSSSSGSRYGIGMSSGLMEFQSGPGGSLGFFVNQGAEAMRVVSSGNVGIGTTNPVYKLDVNGTAQFNNSVIVGTPTAASHAATKSYVDSAAGGGVGAGTSGQTLRHNGTNWIANSTLYNNGTNIGIGTTGPTAKLDVNGTIKANNFYTGYNWSSKSHGLNLGVDGISGGLSFYDGVTLYSASIFREASSSNFYLGVRSGDVASGITIDSGGNIGINNTNPLFKLDVAGTAQFTNSVIVGTPTAASHAATKSYVDSAAGGGVGSGTSGQTLRHNGTNWVSNSSLYNNGTNVGVNSVIPLVRLTVNQGSYNWPATSTTVQTGGFRIQAESGGNVTLDAGVNGSSGAWLQTTNRTDLSQEYPLMLNPNGGNVGVGTTVASYNFDVNGTGRFVNALVVGTPTAASHAATKSYVDSTASSAAGGGVGTGTTGQTLRHNGTSWISNSALYNNGTNIGIGTTTPTEKLEVNGRLKIGNNTVSGENITFDGSTSAGMRVANSSGYISITPLNSSWAHIYTDRYNFIFDKPVYSIVGKFSAYNTSNLELQTAGTTRMTLNATTGYVGIGTTTPDFKLDVAGTAQFTNSVIVGTPTAASHATTKSYVDSAVSGVGGGISTGTSGQTLRHNGTSWVSNSVLYNNGTNVGVGTTNPGSKLEVYGGSIKINGGDINFAMTAGQTATKLVSYSNASGLWMIQPTSQSLILADAVDWDRSAAIQYTPGTTGALAGRLMIGQTAKNSANYTHGITSLYTSGVEQLRINSSGNVGIGTTTPTFKLDVVGTAQFSQPVIVGTPTAINHAATKSYVDSTASSAAGGGVGTGTSGQTLRHNGTSWISNSALYNNGTNVGIGTTVPTAKLHVAGNSYFSGVSNFGGINISSLSNVDTSETMWAYYDASNSDARTGYFGIRNDSSLQVGIEFRENNSGNSGEYFKIKTGSGTDRLFIDESGNVGLSTTTPTFRLDVVGTAQFSQPVIVGTPTATNHAATKSYVDSTAASAASSAAGGGVGTGTSGQTLRHNGTSWVANSLFYNNGTNIGIGTTNPGSLFSILKDSTYNNENSGGLEIAAGTATTSAKLILGAVGTSYSYIQSMQQDWSWATRPLVLMPNGGNVGIGTITPAASLDIFGKLKFTSGGTIYNTDSARWLDMTGTLTDSLKASGDFYSTAGRLKMDGTGVSYVMGTFGVGTTNPGGKFVVKQSGTGWTDGINLERSATTDKFNFTHDAAGRMLIGYNSNNSLGIYSSGLSIGSYAQTTPPSDGLIVNGNVGIATTTPTEAKLVINAGTGMAVKAYGNGIFTGTLQTQTGSDFAEEFITSKDLEPGTVVVMDDNGHKSVKPCAKSYDKTVVGIVSNDPSIIAGRVESKHKAIIAMMGVVKVKVSDVNGKISKGDLLTTSGITGYAMKAQDSKPGTIIGKALENLSSSTGQINVLVNLQ